MTKLDVDLRAAHRRGAAFGNLVRAQTARLPLAAFLVAGAGRPPAHLAGGALLILGSYGVAAAYNDLHDVEIDRANGRNRPLATGTLTAADARLAIAACAGAVAVAQPLLIQPLGLAVTGAAVVAATAYSHGAVGIQRRGLWGTALLAASYLVLPVLLAGRPVSPALVVALIAGGCATLLYKDVKDEAGDRVFGKRTPLIRWGRRRTDRVATLLGMGALVAGALATGLGWWTIAQAGGLATQVAMAATGNRRGRLLTAHRWLAMAGLVGLGAHGS